MVGGRSGVSGSFLSDIWSRDNGGHPTWGGDERRPPAMSALRAVSMANENRAAHGTGQLSRAVETEINC
jgi:hypothetical protein